MTGLAGAVVGITLLGRLSGRRDQSSQWVIGKISVSLQRGSQAGEAVGDREVAGCLWGLLGGLVSSHGSELDPVLVQGCPRPQGTCACGVRGRLAHSRCRAWAAMNVCQSALGASFPVAFLGIILFFWSLLF